MAMEERQQPSSFSRAEHGRAVEAHVELPVFWAAIYGDGSGFMAVLSGRRGAAGLTDVRTSYFAWPGEISAAKHLIARERAEDRELYQCAHLLTRPRRRKEHAAPLASLYVDLDAGELSHEVPPPTVLVASSPGKHHAYWRLTKSVPPQAGELLNRRLTVRLGADKSGWDLTQVLRVPGTLNHKYRDPPMVRILLITDACYDVATIENALTESSEARSYPRAPVIAGEPAPAPADSWLPANLTAYAGRIWRGEDVKRTADGRVDRSASLVRIARVLSGAGVNRDAIVALLAERDVTLGWRKFSDRDDALTQYQAIASLVRP